MQPRKNPQRLPICLLASPHTKCFCASEHVFLKWILLQDPCRFEHLLGEVWTLTKKTGWPAWLWAALFFFKTWNMSSASIFVAPRQELRNETLQLCRRLEYVPSVESGLSLFYIFFASCCLLQKSFRPLSFLLPLRKQSILYFGSFNLCEKNDQERFVLKRFLITKRKKRAKQLGLGAYRWHLIAPWAGSNKSTHPKDFVHQHMTPFYRQSSVQKISVTSLVISDLTV